MSLFKRATRKGIKLRLALVGPSGSGKTYTSLLLAHQLLGIKPGDPAAAERIALLDTEQGSSRRYSGRPFEFAMAPLRDYHPKHYIKAIDDAAQSGFELLVIDSLSHAWSGKGGALELVDRLKKGDNNWSGWADVTPLHRALVESMLGSNLHIIATMRAKTEWAIEGRKPVKVGVGPDQRHGIDYEFDVVLDLDHAHVVSASKTRCADLDGQEFQPGDPALADTLRGWIQEQGDGAQVEPVTEPEIEQAAAPEPEPEPEPEPPRRRGKPKAEANGKPVETPAPEPQTDEPAKSDHETVANLTGRYDHCGSVETLEQIDADRDAAVQTNRLRKTGASWPAIERCRQLAVDRLEVAADLSERYLNARDEPDLFSADGAWNAAIEAGLLPDGHPITRRLTGLRLLAHARLADSGEALKLVAELRDAAVKAGNLLEFDDVLDDLDMALTEAEARLAELEEV